MLQSYPPLLVRTRVPRSHVVATYLSPPSIADVYGASLIFSISRVLAPRRASTVQLNHIRNTHSFRLQSKSKSIMRPPNQFSIPGLGIP
ncbi:hypothetical protein CGRA01v4_10123 [Colletotrichum graminicola]|nr:hypothetical protein CGRA01v4_10123 [Colletotrichum graminicola]